MSGIFCSVDQVADEAAAALELIREAYGSLDINPIATGSLCPGLVGSMSPRPSCCSVPLLCRPRYWIAPVSHMR